MSNEWVNHSVSTTKWTAVFSFAIIGVLFIVGLVLPQESEAGAVMPKPLLFESPIGNPALTVDKTADHTAPQPGDIVNYTIAYTNTNPGSQAFNVRLYDFLPAGVQFISASPAPASVSDGTLLFTAPSVGPDTAGHAITVQVRVLSGHASWLNQTLVTADGITPATDALLITVTPATDHLQLIKEGDMAALLHGELEYTLHCENNGLVAYHNVEVFDVLPTGVTLVSASVPPATVIPPLLKWTIGTLPPGAGWEVDLVAVAPANAEIITNTAVLNAPTHTSVQALWATHVITEGAILSVDKAGSDDAVYPGDTLVYTLTYGNKGSITASNIILTDTLPADVVVGDALPAPDYVDGQQWVWEVDALGAGDTATIVITTTVASSAAGMLHNRVVISAPGAWGDTDSLYTTVQARAIYLPLVLRTYNP